MSATASILKQLKVLNIQQSHRNRQQFGDAAYSTIMRLTL
jgi:hypothetical protein